MKIHGQELQKYLLPVVFGLPLVAVVLNKLVVAGKVWPLEQEELAGVVEKGVVSLPTRATLESAPLAVGQVGRVELSWVLEVVWPHAQGIELDFEQGMVVGVVAVVGVFQQGTEQD